MGFVPQDDIVHEASNAVYTVGVLLGPFGSSTTLRDFAAHFGSQVHCAGRAKPQGTRVQPVGESQL